jgi:hypothetical protein
MRNYKNILESAKNFPIVMNIFEANPGSGRMKRFTSDDFDFASNKSHHWLKVDNHFFPMINFCSKKSSINVSEMRQHFDHHIANN